MLDDDGRLEIRGDLLEALERRHRLGAIEVERRHTIRIVILAEVRGIAADHHGPHLRQLDEQALMAGRMPRCPQHDHAAVAEHVLVERERFDLALALALFSNGLKFTPSAGFGLVIASHSRLPISSVAFGNEPTWPV